MLQIAKCRQCELTTEVFDTGICPRCTADNHEDINASVKIGSDQRPWTGAPGKTSKKPHSKTGVTTAATISTVSDVCRWCRKEFENTVGSENLCPECSANMKAYKSGGMSFSPLQ